jgi:glycerophosphoryl diester phosphodiesterase
MLILSHRGYHVRSPALESEIRLILELEQRELPQKPVHHDNTMEAFSQAVALGIDGIETDVRICSEGVPIIFHDRYTPNGLDISSISKLELESIIGYAIPTLESVIERWDGILWNLEIKTPLALEATLAIVRRFYHSTRFLITSYWHPIIEEFSRRLDVECGLLIAHRPLDSVAVSEWFPRNSRLKTIVWDYEIVDGEILQRTASHGLLNFVYGPITTAEHNHLIQWGVDGVITDYPEFLLKTLSRF